ncbi:MAG: hypothetical protein K2H04_04195, partial [Bacteroidaceae bacterium]|nr:hypothetical protein [Bacteroidaceae bacterium]
PTSTNRSPRHRLVGVGDSDLEAVKAHSTQACPTGVSDLPPEDDEDLLPPKRILWHFETFGREQP